MNHADLFMAEAKEYLENLNRCLLVLEQKPGDRENMLEMFRIVHSLKGMAGTMGYGNITELTHQLESFLEEVKSGAIELNADTVDVLFEAVDLLQHCMDDPAKEDAGIKRALQKLSVRFSQFMSPSCHDVDKEAGKSAGGSVRIGEMEKEIIRMAREKGAEPYLVHVSLSEGTEMKSVRVYMVLHALKEYGEIVGTAPAMQDLEDERFDTSFCVGVIVYNPSLVDSLKERVLKIGEVAAVTVSGWEVETECVEAEGPSGKTEGEPEGGTLIHRAAEKLVRVEAAKLDELINLVGEMVVAKTRAMEVGCGYSEELDETLDQLKRITTNLQDISMKLRMMPIKQVFDRFPRMVRDLSRDRGKTVNLHISGEETELDRAIINQLSDPLVHLLRNAVDHGIEPAAERIKRGKEAAGNIILKACHEGNHVVITVEDDGAGLDPKRLKEAALAKGFITQEEASSMSREEAFNLIFYSGLSTSARVTSISGRGVGMDAVKKSIERLRGTIEVYSKPETMTRFVIRLPLTLAIIKALLVKALGVIYAIPIEVICENVCLEPGQWKTIRGHRVLNLRGEVIPLHSLSELLSMEAVWEETCHQPVVIVEVGNKKAGLLVDELVRQQEIVIKTLSSVLRSMKGIAGATILGDGTVALVLDVMGLLNDGREGYGQNCVGC